MKTSRTFLRNTAMLCAIIAASVSMAGEGVVRISDRSKTPENSGASGVVRISDKAASGIQKASFNSQGSCGEASCLPQPCPFQCCPGSYPMCDPCSSGDCNSGICGNGMCGNGPCNNNGSFYTPMDCNACFSNGMAGGWGNNCQSCQNSWGQEFNQCRAAGNDCRNGCPPCFWKKCGAAGGGVCDCLFGWMIPAGNCGQGSPWFGKYHMAYADQPSYVDPRDTRLYAAQGYGMPMTVPLAPNVNYAYNYSAGLPASRITQIGNYNPQTSPRRLPCQTW